MGRGYGSKEQEKEPQKAEEPASRHIIEDHRNGIETKAQC